MTVRNTPMRKSSLIVLQLVTEGSIHSRLANHLLGETVNKNNQPK